MKTFRRLAAALGVVLGCTPPPGQVASSPIQPPVASACEELRGARFRSVEHFPGGLGPDGPVVGYQYLSFSENGQQYDWTNEDMAFTGGYRCDGASIAVPGTPFTNNRPFVASFDAERGILTWNGLEFTRSN